MNTHTHSRAHTRAHTSLRVCDTDVNVVLVSQVLSTSSQSINTPSTGGSAHAYGPIGGNARTSHTPVVLRAEEVM